MRFGAVYIKYRKLQGNSMAIRIKFKSLETRLIIVLLFIAILSTITVGWIAYNLMFENIRSERIKAVGRVADSKHEQLVMVLTRANSRAESFLQGLSVQCGGSGTKLNQVCATGLIRSYLAAEGAIGATIRWKGDGDSLTIGTSSVHNEENITLQPGQLAKFSGTGLENNRSYFISVAEESTGLQLAITYPSSTLEPVFDAPEELGYSGETFLTDGEGYFVTKPKYPSAQGHSHPISARPMQSCLSGEAHEVLDLDYRDAAIIHGFRFIPEFGSACIMAHITQDEAFAPLKLLEQRLIIATFLFGVILIITAVYLSKKIVRPINKLTKTTRIIAAGDYKAQADVEGSDEISELATSFNFMTDRLQSAQRRLLQDEARLRATIETAMDAVVQMDSDGVIIGWTSHAEKIFGWTPEEAIGRVLHETIIPFQQRDAHVQGLKRFLLSGWGPILNSRIEITGLHRDGHEFPVELTVAPIKIAGEYEFSAFIRDITERKQAELEIHTLTADLERRVDERTAELQRLQSEHERILNSVSEGIHVLNLDGKIIFENPASATMLGYEIQELIGKPAHPTMHHTRADGSAYPQCACHIYATLHDGVPRHVEDEVFWRKDDTSFYVDYVSTAIRDAAGEIVGVVVAFSDITERRQAEKLLNQAKEHAEYANRAKDSFLATMSHEIRTPLSGLLGKLEMLSLSPLNSQQVETLQTARDSGQSLLRILNDILDWSKIEAGLLQLSPQSTSTAKLIDGVVNTYSHVASSKGLVLWHHADPRLSPVHLVDPLRLSQVLNNFVSNAIKFTSKGEVEVRAELLDRQDGFEQVRFSVKDTGVGIAKYAQQRLFQSYGQATADTARMYGGTGLGLSISRRLAELMDGRIELESTPGQGSTFSITLTLPIIKIEPGESTTARTDVLSIQPIMQDVANAPTVLVVDDHPINRTLLVDQVEMLGLRAEGAENGESALALWREGRFGLVITDCHMPKMDGYKLTATIRKIEAEEGRPRVPIIAYTGNALSEENERCLAAGMDEVMVKPADLAQLRAILMRWLPEANSVAVEDNS